MITWWIADALIGAVVYSQWEIPGFLVMILMSSIGKLALEYYKYQKINSLTLGFSSIVVFGTILSWIFKSLFFIQWKGMVTTALLGVGILCGPLFLKRPPLYYIIAQSKLIMSESEIYQANFYLGMIFIFITLVSIWLFKLGNQQYWFDFKIYFPTFSLIIYTLIILFIYLKRGVPSSSYTLPKQD